MSSFRLSPRARADLREIAAYISQFNADAAIRLVSRLKAVCRDTLATAPELGTRCDEYLPGMRCFSVGNYVIFFRDRNPVEVLRIVHGKRDFGRLSFDSDEDV
jgi:toxin ParE1/3/4